LCSRVAAVLQLCSRVAAVLKLCSSVAAVLQFCSSVAAELQFCSRVADGRMPSKSAGVPHTKKTKAGRRRDNARTTTQAR